ncbi:MAG: MarR family transcriptional regulator [Bacteroidales bacterium]|jgi:DNA-binding MarR family transcriptional regulator|nr:MarR family transcriptional regulator [Bacteroidales bacterium]
MKAQETVGYQVKTAWQSIAKMYNRLTVENGFSQAIGYVLINVKKGGIPVTKIAPQMGIEPTSLSRLLNTMEDKELIYREKDTVDRRVVNLFLTEKGLELQKISKKIVIDYNNYIFSHLDENEKETFFKVIEKINALTNDISMAASLVEK